MSHTGPEPERVLVVDDDPHVRRLIERILRDGGHLSHSVDSAEGARSALAEQSYALVLCDVQLPGEGGMEFLRELSSPDVATLMVTGIDSAGLADDALELGAYGYITKPFKSSEVRIGVTNALRRRRLELESRAQRGALEGLVADRTRSLETAMDRLEGSAQELRRSRTETIWRLSRAVEFRDEETGGHIERMSRYCELLAGLMGLDAESMRIASPMHDVGKIAVPDSILLKPGALTDEERDEMQLHTEIGFSLLSDSDSDLLQLAATIALTHHERFDGGGYPHGLRADAIPLPGQIAAIADVFDALTSDRVYRAAFSVERAVAIMSAERGTQFNPVLLDAFLEQMDPIEAIRADSQSISPRRSATATAAARSATSSLR